jgi:hypothetical protein
MRRSPFAILPSLICLICLLCGPSTSLLADEGHPVAIRFWPEQAVTIETMWNLHVGLRNNYTKEILPRIPDLELRMEKEPVGDVAYPELLHVWSGSPSHEYVLDRKPNEEKPAWSLAEEFEDRSSNSVLVWHIPVELATAAGKPAFVSMIAVDGVRIVDAGGATAKTFLAAMQASPAHVRMLPSVDAILLTAPGPDAESLTAIAELMKPRMIVMSANADLESVGDAKIRAIEHNTLALSASKEETSNTSYVSLGESPCQMSEDMAGLYTKKEAACKSSREIFAALSVEQMNFVPGDGSHTPRWNAEHMMGRELGFFSKIYNGIDSAIPALNLNPEQMPDQYKAAHPDWNGAEEARQMERVQAFNRRFAFMLDGVGVDDRVKGNPFGTLRRLLVQMDRHYGEHTGNVIKKMKLPNWPTK